MTCTFQVTAGHPGAVCGVPVIPFRRDEVVAFTMGFVLNLT